MYIKEQGIYSPKDNIAVFLPGLGAVATTLIAGVEAVKRKLALPIGSYSQMGKITVRDNTVKRISDIFPLAKLEQLIFGGWDIYPENCFDIAIANKVLDKILLEQVREPLSSISPMPAVFDQVYVPKLTARISKKPAIRWNMLNNFVMTFVTLCLLINVSVASWYGVLRLKYIIP